MNFSVLRHFNHPGKSDHLDIVVDSMTHFGRTDLPLMKFEVADGPSGIAIATYGGNVRERYLTYEGPMDGNRGEVKRIDQGAGHIQDTGEIYLDGNILKGRFELILRKF